ncbi:MAG: hypothetical protein R3202_14590 [Candidatus Competibacterales bacterium]|nr:hypothetical protein [Candidatus Competibacterales bacterium]
MWFGEIERQDTVLHTAQRLQNRLVQGRQALRGGQSERADAQISEALNELIRVIQHLQTHYAVREIEFPNHEPLLLWFDRRMLDRLVTLNRETGRSPRQLVLDLLQHGQLPDTLDDLPPDNG